MDMEIVKKRLDEEYRKIYGMPMSESYKTLMAITVKIAVEEFKKAIAANRKSGKAKK